MTDPIIIQVDRTLTGMEAIRATGLTLGHIDEDVVGSMPAAQCYTVEIICVELRDAPGNPKIEFQKYVEECVDPHTFLAFIKALPGRDLNDYATWWRLEDGAFGYILSYAWMGYREVRVFQSVAGGWGDRWSLPLHKSHNTQTLDG